MRVLSYLIVACLFVQGALAQNTSSEVVEIVSRFLQEQIDPSEVSVFLKKDLPRNIPAFVEAVNESRETKQKKYMQMRRLVDQMTIELSRKAGDSHFRLYVPLVGGAGIVTGLVGYMVSPAVSSVAQATDSLCYGLIGVIAGAAVTVACEMRTRSQFEEQFHALTALDGCTRSLEKK